MQIFRLPLSKPVEVDGVMYDKVPMPVYATAGAAAFDLYSANTEDITIQPNTNVLIPLGIKVAVEFMYKLTIKPRSGLSIKFHISITNSPGTVDSDYRGEVCAVVENHSDIPFVVTPLMRICQGEIEEAKQYAFAEVTEEEQLGVTARADGGFDSTGTGVL
jgi:dUTP pyrophosphatase